MNLSITLIIIIITCIVSINGFGNRKIINELIFYPPAISENNQWYRFFTCGLIHADYAHLAFNMYAFYLFGSSVENAFIAIFEPYGKILYIALYVSALLVSLLPTYNQHKDNTAYRSLGASGAVSAVVFAYILLFPLQKLGIIFIPFYIPGFIFGLLYLAISSYMGRKGVDNINHSAHIWGGIYGVAFLLVLSDLISDYPVLPRFISDVTGYLKNLY
jgi:membrane associated rhomboid family serine protease